VDHQFYRSVNSRFVLSLRPKKSSKLILVIIGAGTPHPLLQLGFPKLPEAGSSAQFDLLREWLSDCDGTISHRCKPESNVKLPTRVIDVGDINSNLLRLHDPQPGDDTRYIALSHRWGSDIPLQTLKGNLSTLKETINFNDLPKTFRDAVTITREVKVRFLWIDSLCIIQDDEEDWAKEATLMENVFSSAYCTIAASCARGTNDGFLKSRRERQCVEMQVGSFPPFYICELIDDFRGDVEQGDLNKRGWVLQERVLSRRTIYFTETQVYWECGDGVKCETLTKMDK
jgi:hypothetical protein